MSEGILDKSNKLAIKLNNAFIEPEHLLFILLSDKQICLHLANIGIECSKIRQKILSFLRRRGKRFNQRLPISHGLFKILNEAAKEAAANNFEAVSEADFLRSIVSIYPGICNGILRKYGKKIRALRWPEKN